MKGFNQVWQRSFMEKDLFMMAINNYWGIENSLEIEFASVTSEEDLHIKFEDSMISFVDGDNSNNMTLSLGLSGHQLLSVFTHELGHVLGFKDCYVEFFNPRKSNLIYYTLDGNQSNLMCEITKEAIVPFSYKQQVLKTYCQVE